MILLRLLTLREKPWCWRNGKVLENLFSNPLLFYFVQKIKFINSGVNNLVMKLSKKAKVRLFSVIMVILAIIFLIFLIKNGWNMEATVQDIVSLFLRAKK